MPRLEELDYFTDYKILKEPYEFFEAVRKHGPVWQPPGRDYLIVTGFDEALQVLKNHHDFSACIGVAGAAAPLPFVPHGSDISEQLEAHRSRILGGDLLVNLDDIPHSNMRSLVNRLFTPSRLRANQEFIAAYSEELMKDAVAKRSVELIKTISTPFVTLVIADMLGVPAEDRQHFMNLIDAAPPPGSLNSSENDFSSENHPMVAMAGYFARYLMERQQHPRGDILSELAHATFPDGTKPRLEDLVSLSTFIFGAGQDTSAKLLGNSMRHIVDQPGLQDQLRQDPSLIPAMLEEILRLEGSTKQTARLARRWPDPQTFVLDRPKIEEHIGFGRGKHVCAGAPLARVEVRIILERFLKYTSNIDLDETKHGPRGQRELNFEPSFIIRGLAELHLRLTPSAARGEAA